jgi:hypothetical protein
MDFVTGVQATDGTVAARSSGAPPAANGGPAVTVNSDVGTSSSGTVASGGSSLAHLRASSPFQTVYVSVTDDPLDGYYKLTLPAATTDAFVIVKLGSSIPVNTFQTVFSVASASGVVGDKAQIANTVSTTAAATVNVTGQWIQTGNTLTLTLTQTGNTVTGTASSSSASGGTRPITCVIAGSTFTYIDTFTTSTQCTEVVSVSLQVSGNTMSGSYVYTSLSGSSCTIAVGTSSPITFTKM